MSKKGQDLKAFLNKNKKKTTAKQETKPEQAEAAEAISKEAAPITEKAEVKAKPAKKDESSDEEVDDDLDLDVQYGNIKENKDVTTDKVDEENKTGFGYDDVITRPSATEKPKKTPGAGDIVFRTGGTKPMFTRKNKTGMAGDFDAGLDDLDDDGNVKNKGQKEASKAMAGGREWINLGSSAKVRRADDENPMPRKEAKKPSFFGKMNLKNTGDGGEDAGGPKHNYDFGVKFKSNEDT